MIDSHAHLYYEGILERLELVIENARSLGISHILTVGTDSQNLSMNVKISEDYDNVFSSIGIHPSSFNGGYDLTVLEELAQHEKVVAIGEIGLDYHYQDDTPRLDQIKLFRDMLVLSERTGLPCIFHARECFEDIFGIISEYKIHSGVFHCYTDSLENAKKVLDLGYYISFSGIITFKNSNDLREVVKYVPDDRLLIETDSPYLAPVPKRGQTNEPAFVRLVAELVSNLRGTSISDISEITDRNFFNLFSKAQCFVKKGI